MQLNSYTRTYTGRARDAPIERGIERAGESQRDREREREMEHISKQ